MKDTMKALCTLALLLLMLPLLNAAPYTFPETWAFLYHGEERYFPKQMAPFTDIACFSAKIDVRTILTGGPEKPPKLPGALATARYHLVISAPWNRDIVHLFLNKDLPFRQQLIDQIVARAKPFDGLMIDIESMDKKDGTAFLNFLAALKQALPKEKIFSVAVLPRWEAYARTNPSDPFDYPFINRFCDRIIVMTYDEHYQGSNPGPIASEAWCKKILNYARTTIDADKLIMGIPLYGRSWQSASFAKNYRHHEALKTAKKYDALLTPSATEGNHFSFTETVQVDVYFESTQSIEQKLKLYTDPAITGVAFWRVGQEPDGVWDLIHTP